MPIYEFECRECRTSFELLMRSDTKVACPACESEKVLRKLSMFAAHTGQERRGRSGLPYRRMRMRPGQVRVRALRGRVARGSLRDRLSRTAAPTAPRAAAPPMGRTRPSTERAGGTPSSTARSFPRLRRPARSMRATALLPRG